MSPSFPKLLADLGRQFLWSPLTAITVKREQHPRTGGKKEINSTFYCNGDTIGSGCGGSSCSVECLSAHIPDQESIGDISAELNDRNCLSTTYCSHYYTNYDKSIDTTDETDIKFIISSDLKPIHKWFSEPNLLINTSSAYSDLVSVETLITYNNSKSDVHNKHNFRPKTVTSTSTISSTTSERSNSPSDEIETIRNTNPYNRLLEEIDWFNTSNTCALSVSNICEQSSSAEAEEEDFVSEINNIITKELCQNYLSDETNDDKSISNRGDRGQCGSIIESELNSCETNVSKKKSNKMNRNYINCDQIVEKIENDEKMQQNLRQKIQTNSGDESVVLNDYFDNCAANDFEAKAGAEGLPKRHSLSSVVISEDERKSTVCSRNSRRLIVTDKRLKNAVLDRLKRLGRSQSHGRSDTPSLSSTTLTSRQFVLRTKGLYKNVKRRFSSVPPTADCLDEEEPTRAQNISIDDEINEPNMTTYSKINVNTLDRLLNSDNNTPIDTTIAPAVVLRHCSSFESIEDSGCGSSIQTSSLSTDSNRSSICTGDDINGSYSSALLRGPFIGYAKAITDCTPCPYYKDALTFKRGDIISIISKDESGTWIGMANGRIGHFKFVSVEEIKHIGDKRKQQLKLNQLVPVTIEQEINDNLNNSLDLEITTKFIFKKLNQRLIESNGALSLTDIKHLIGLSDLQLNLLSIYGYNDLKLLAKIENKDILNECGITDTGAQQQVFNITRLLRDYYFGNTISANSNQQLIRPQNTSQKYPPKRRELRCVSAPTTPAITPNIDFSSEHFSQLMSKLSSVSTTSLENSCSYEELQQQFSNMNTIDEINDNKRAQNLNNSNKITNNERIYENNEQIIIATHEQQNPSTFDFLHQKHNSSDNKTSDISTSSKQLKNRHNSVRFATIRDKSLDRNLLRKLDLKPIYMNDRNSCELSTTARPYGMSRQSSQSVVDLRTNTINSSINESTINNILPIDTLRSKKRLKKLISSSRKFSTFSSHSSLMSLANSTTPSDDSSRNKIISNTLVEAIEIKLNSENIDLTEEPYSDSAGFCGIPPALIQRYTDECQRDTYEVAEALDSLRMKGLTLKGRRGIPNDYLGDSCVGPVIDLVNYESLHLWLISLGLPMYENCLKANGYENLYRVSKLREVDVINKCGIRDRRHIRILTNAIGALHLSLGDIDKT